MPSPFDRYLLVMAEIALGGLQVVVKRSRPRPCEHGQILTTITCGLQREVCETCGHVSVSYIRPIAGPIDRHRFARQADLVSAAEQEKRERFAQAIEVREADPYVPIGVFSIREHFSIRTRI